jgi:hypothetical protein
MVGGADLIEFFRHARTCPGHDDFHIYVHQASRAVGGLACAPIEHANLLFRYLLVKSQGLGLEVAFWHMGGQEVMIVIPAADQRRPVPCADCLLQMGRDIADGEPNAPVIGAVRL